MLSIGEYAFIGKNSTINSCYIGANVRIGDGCVLEAFTVIHDNCIIDDGVKIGAHCVIPPGTRVTVAGFWRESRANHAYCQKRDIQLCYAKFVIGLC